jgi:ribonucleoside-diphosphate reductase alpha chain
MRLERPDDFPHQQIQKKRPPMQAIDIGADTIAPNPQRVVSATPAAASAFDAFHIIRRNGAVVSFEPSKIAVALMKAFLAVHGTQGAASASVRETVDVLTESVVRALLRSRPGGGTFHIEDVHGDLIILRLCNTYVSAVPKTPNP